MFRGSYVALATPFTRGGRLDVEGVARLVAWHRSEGTSGVVMGASTGESPTLTDEERRVLLTTALAAARGSKLKVIAYTGTNVTSESVDRTVEAGQLGAHATLVVSPYYNKPTQTGLIRHFSKVADASRVPVILYDVPGRTGVGITPRTVVEMAQHRKVVGLKDASGDLDHVTAVVAGTPKGFSVLSGDDSLTLPMLSVGATGVISVVANVAPRDTARMVSRALEGRFDAARRIHHTLFPLVKALFVESNPIPVKAAMELMGLPAGKPRLPLTVISNAGRSVVREALVEYGVLSPSKRRRKKR
jgi:4-hydroxy-tetrahydrodipicolinate synthase